MPPDPSLTEAKVRELLRHCYDPRIPLNIVDLGLLQAVAVAVDPDAPGSGIPGVPPRHRVTVELIPADTSEEGQAQLRAQVENLLAGLPEVWQAAVTLVDEPAWTPARISADGRRQLKLDPPRFPILNNRPR
jgi:metal-sulfur cluster biosynthetic enzyme